MELTQHERDSALWGKIARHMQERIDNLRRSNDNDSNDALRTASIRGQIKEAKALLSLADDKPAFEKSTGAK